MRAIVAIGVIGICGCVVSGCADPNTAPRHISFADSQDTLVMGPNLRLVSQRARSIDGRGALPTVCTEPSPDVAIAFNRTFSGNATITPPTGGTTVQGQGSAALNEQASELKGREAGVLALRDGLYAACQSYVNGVLGHDAYAVILSQYGNLLVALTGTATTGTRTSYSAAESAVAALFVACISEYDPTRIYARTDGKYKVRYRDGSAGHEHRPLTNPMLSQRRCSRLLDKIANGTFLLAEAKAKKAAANKKTQQAADTAGKGNKDGKGGKDSKVQMAKNQPMNIAPNQKVTKTEKQMTKTVTETTGAAAAKP